MPPSVGSPKILINPHIVFYIRQHGSQPRLCFILEHAPVAMPQRRISLIGR